MKSVKAKVRNGMGGSESFSQKGIEGKQPDPVARGNAVAGSSSKYPGSQKLAMSDNPGETSWSPVGGGESYPGAMKVDPSEGPGPSSYPSASPSVGQSKVPFQELGAHDPAKTATKMDAGLGAASDLANKKRPLKKNPSMI